MYGYIVCKQNYQVLFFHIILSKRDKKGILRNSLPLCEILQKRKLNMSFTNLHMTVKLLTIP